MTELLDTKPTQAEREARFEADIAAGREPTDGMLSIASAEGDTRIMWNPSDADETAAARAAFEDAKGRGMLAYAVADDGSKLGGEVLRKFPKKAGKVILSRNLVGG